MQAQGILPLGLSHLGLSQVIRSGSREARIHDAERRDTFGSQRQSAQPLVPLEQVAIVGVHFDKQSHIAACRIDQA